MVSKHRSLYVVMRDGVRLAVDVHLPANTDGGPVPTILHQTRYFRSLAIKRGFGWVGLGAAMDSDWKTRRRFLEAGYAWVDVCVRGSGASFGSRPCPWSPDEVGDGPELLDWVVAQPWSNGVVGATGISYAGTSAELLGASGHPALRAVAPRFSCFDVYPDVAFPGGLHLEWFTGAWGQFNALLDDNNLSEALALNLFHTARACEGLPGLRWAPLRLAGRPWVQRLLKRFVSAVSHGVAAAERSGAKQLVRDAATAHQANYDVHRGALQVTFRDDPGLSEALPQATIDDFSPHRRVEALRASGIAVLNYSGWLDGAYAGAAVKRHHALGSSRSRLVIGPWNHGGQQDISPFTAPGPPTDVHADALLAFFDHHLRDLGPAGPPVKYFTMGEQVWKTAPSWPPPEVRMTSLFLGESRELTDTAPVSQGTHTYQVDLALGSGNRARWNSLLGLRAPIGYDDAAPRCERMLCYTAPPLTDPLEVTGNPVVHLRLAADQPDVAVFAYLMDVAPNGAVTTVTEGLLRAKHRGNGESFPAPGAPLPHTFLRQDARPLTPGLMAALSLTMLPTSYRLAKGHLLRLAIAGADADHFRSPTDTAPTLSLAWGGSDPPRFDVPIAG